MALFTTNPNEVPTAQTTPSAADVVAMLLKCWPDLSQNGARTLAAQFMAETGGGKFCFNWNLGNVNSGVTSSHTTSTRIPIVTSLGSMLTTLLFIRQPSSSSIIASTYGTSSANAGFAG